MLGNSVFGLGRLGYGALYVVPASHLYILATDSMVSVPYLKIESTPILSLTLLILSLYAAIWMHRVALLIFGDLAGMHSTKPDEISNKHITYFATGVAPSELPETPSMFESIYAAVMSEEMSWGAFARFFPAAFLFGYALIAWVWITLIFFTVNGDLVAGAFWLVLTVLVTQNRVIGYLPSYIPRESISGISEAEYVRNQRLVRTEIGTENRPRIRKTENMGQRRSR